nr:P protein-like [Onthophagus taurus]
MFRSEGFVPAYFNPTNPDNHPPSISVEFGGEQQSKSQNSNKHVITETQLSFKRTVSFIDDDVFDFSQPDQDVDRTRLKNKSKCKVYCGYIKVIVLVLIFIPCCAILMNKSVNVTDVHHLSVNQNDVKEYLIYDLPKQDCFSLKLQGAILPGYYSNLSRDFMEVWVDVLSFPETISINKTNFKNHLLKSKKISNIWKVPLSPNDWIRSNPEIKQQKLFHLNQFKCSPFHNCVLSVNFKTNLNRHFPISVSYNLNPINTEIGALYAAFVLIFLYVLIVFEIIHKTFAAMLVSSVSVALLALLDAKPTVAEIISWIDWETVLMLFSMMILVAVFSETGIFNYIAVTAFKVTGGKMWPLINVLCFTTAVLSCFLDNVTTALLMTPVTIRLCEVMKINPVPVLTNMVIYSNIGGACTPIGDPPNIIIASNENVIKSGITFSTFTLHMSLGVFIALIVANIQLRIIYRNESVFKYSEPSEVHEIRKEMEVWKRTAESMSSYSKQEVAVKDSMMKRTCRLGKKLYSRTSCKSLSSLDDKNIDLHQLAAKYPIKDKSLLIKSSVCLVLVITGFFLNSLPVFSRLGLGEIAFLGSILLIIIADRDDLSPIIAKIEWETLLFFIFLFILMEALSKLGLIDWMGSKTQSIIMSMDESSRLPAAILIILWVSAFASSLVDNIPLTTMMIRIATGLAHDKDLNLPLQPLIWALAFGACFGGNGTIFGSTSNIVCAGVSEQHGYKFSFLGFMKIGFPIMISTVSVVTIYLLIAHVVFNWN